MNNLSDEDRCDNARVIMSGNCRLPKASPRSSNALQFHIQRAQCQSMVWIQATCNIPLLPQPETMRWSKGNGKLVPTLMSLSPIHDTCAEAIICGCTKVNVLAKRKPAPSKIVQVQRLSSICTMSIGDVVKRKWHSSYCSLYTTKRCVQIQ